MTGPLKSLGTSAPPPRLAGRFPEETDEPDTPARPRIPSSHHHRRRRRHHRDPADHGPLPAAHADARPTRATAVRNAASALLAHAASLGLTSAEGTSVRDVIVDKDGTQHVRYDRTYHGLPVLGGD